MFLWFLDFKFESKNCYSKVVVEVEDCHDRILMCHDRPPTCHDRPPVCHDRPPTCHDIPPTYHDRPPMCHDRPPLCHEKLKEEDDSWLGGSSRVLTPANGRLSRRARRRSWRSSFRLSGLKEQLQTLGTKVKWQSGLVKQSHSVYLHPTYTTLIDDLDISTKLQKSIQKFWSASK